MVWYWELIQGHGKAQTNTIKHCKIFLALANSKLNVLCIFKATFSMCVTDCSWLISVDASIFLLLPNFYEKKHRCKYIELHWNTTSRPMMAQNSLPPCLCSDATENDSPLVTSLCHQSSNLTPLWAILPWSAAKTLQHLACWFSWSKPSITVTHWGKEFFLE